MESHLGCISVARHRIKLIDDHLELIYSVIYRAGPKRVDCEKVEIEEMRSQKIVKPTQTECAAQIIFAQMRDKKLHFCLDYHKRNDVTERNLVSIRRIN